MPLRVWSGLTATGCSGWRRAKASSCEDSLAPRSTAALHAAQALLQDRAASRREQLQQLHIAADNMQDVIEVVRDAAGELADRLQLLRMMQRAARFLQRWQRSAAPRSACLALGNVAHEGADRE